MTPVSLKLRNGCELVSADAVLLDGLLTNWRDVPARQDIVRDGDRPGEVRVILEGIACRYKLLAGGKRAIMAYLLPGDFCDLHVSILGRMDHSIGTVTACTVADLPHDSITRVLQTQPRLSRALWWATLVDEAILREWLVNMGQRPADRKLAHLLCELRLRLQLVGSATCRRMKLPMTQEELGNTLGISSVHVNRVFQQLKHDGLILMQGRELEFPDLRALERFGEFDPDYLHLRQELAQES